MFARQAATHCVTIGIIREPRRKTCHIVCYALNGPNTVKDCYEMNRPDDPVSASGPSAKTLKKSVAWTFVAAAVVTVLFVLPAEYGVDPAGTGKWLGLTRLSAARAPDMDAAPRVVIGTFPEAPTDEAFDYFEPEVLGDPFSRSHERPYRTDTLTIALDEFEQVEVKTVMRQGDALIYRWKLIEGNTVYTDFHADPLEVDRYPADYWIRYAESESGAASGSLVAPFDGNHGWYWLNIEENPVRIELEVSGFYESVEEIMRSFQ